MKTKSIIVFLVLFTTLFLGHGRISKKDLKYRPFSKRPTTEVTALDFSKLPLNIPDGQFQPLLNYENSELKFELEQAILKNKHWKSLIETKKMSIGVVDLNNPEKPRFASLNGNEMMYAASLPKIAVLLTTENALENGELPESKKIYSDMRLMISKSNNQATTRLIDLVGYDKIERVLTKAEYNLYDVKNGGGLWVGKRYAASGPTNREPLKNLSHAATVNQVCRFYYLLANGRLVTRERSEHMLKIMENPELHHKFVYALDKIAPHARVFRKSGSWKNWHSDSVLVWDEERKYILVALIDNEHGEQIIRNLVSPVEKVLKLNQNDQ